MALIACPECGKQVSDKARACPDCGAPIADDPGSGERRVQEVVLRPAALVDGKQLGHDTARALTNPNLALVWFVLIWLVTGIVLGYRAGYLDADPIVWWWVLTTFVAPVPVAIVLRRPLRRIVPVVLGGGCGLLSLAFFVAIFAIAAMFVWNLIDR